MKNSININSGKYKGKKIFLPNIETTRPSKSIVRNSIFNTLQTEIQNIPFIEFFAGSGSIGFEAISRGASKVIFLELNRIAIDNLKRNRANFPEEDIEIISGDSFSNINKLLNSLDNKKAIFYIDPPFSIRDGMENIHNLLYKILATIDIKYIEHIIFEHSSDEVVPENIGIFKIRKSKRFGQTTISYYN